MTFSTGLTKVNDVYMPMIEKQLDGSGFNLNNYSKQCVMSAISAINAVMDVKGITWNDPQLDQSNITETLLKVAALQLNATATPREIFFQVRNVKKSKGGKDEWVKQIEMGIEGDGNDSLLARFGRDVQAVKQFWLVRENDQFSYPSYSGLEMTPPQWTPSGKGKVVRVVYPIIKTDKTVEFYIAEREDVAKNLIAHINNNLMNETFGIAKSRYDATPKQKQEISKKKREILNKVQERGLESLNDPELDAYISPAWKDPQSQESMIIRKMRNNVVKKIPKDFGNAVIQMSYEDSVDGEAARVNREISENANRETIDVEVSEPVARKEEKKRKEEAEPIKENERREESKQEKEYQQDPLSSAPESVSDDPVDDFEAAAAGGPGY